MISTSNAESTCIEIEPEHAADASVILLHGGGGQNREFLAMLKHFTPARGRVRFILPNAPERPLSLFGGVSMRAWFDVVHADLQREVDTKGIQHSVGVLQGLIKREIQRGIACERIVIGGFSQGGVIALRTGACYPWPLAGVIALSAYWPEAALPATELARSAGRPPVFIGHGRDDDLVSLALAEQARQTLAGLGHTVQFEVYPTGHGVAEDELSDVKAWIDTVLA